MNVKIECNSQSIAFAPNITPGTFNDPPSPADALPDSLLFPASDEDGAAARRGAAHGKKKPENHIPRPPNAFILFRSSFIKNQHVSSEVETNHSTLSKIIGLTWQNLPHEERQVWHTKAKIALEEHKRKFPQYAFRPLHTKGKSPSEKRKVREVEPKDHKRCAKIAQLLVEGKKGRELDQAIQEFDRNHVPVIVTRFEEPITARHYRRSSSAPAPDTEHTESDWYNSPSSPNVTTTPSYSLPPTNPSFCLWRQSDDVAQFPDTFSFDSTATPAIPQYQACDPLDQQGAPYDAYQHGSQESGVAAPEVYDPTCLTINTSFLDGWTASSSPVSSMPGTPQVYAALHAHCDPMSVMDNYLPSLHDSYDPSAEFLPQQQQQQYYTPGGMPAYCEPTGVDMSYGGAQDFGGPVKGDFSSFYGRSAVHPVDAAAFAPTYLASVPTFAM
ncbi:hypothetical protein FKP32DRAFT_1612755 [Trametes sanguinea]|nr:hypothetical protein FKP32DRAFT_1612755 [Trametes sanguinea]